MYCSLKIHKYISFLLLTTNIFFAQNWVQTYIGELHESGLFQTHVWTTNQNDFLPGHSLEDFTYESSSFYVSETPFSGGTTIYHFWGQHSDGGWTNLYTTNYAEGNHDYFQYENILGYIYPPTNQQPDDDIVICYRIHNHQTNDYYYTTNYSTVEYLNNLPDGLSYDIENNLGWLPPPDWDPGPLDIPFVFIEYLFPINMIQDDNLSGYGYASNSPDQYIWFCETHNTILSDDQTLFYDNLSIGQHNIALKAYNNIGWGCSEYESINVEAPVYVSSIPNQEIILDNQFNYQVEAYGGYDIGYQLINNPYGMLYIDNYGSINGILNIPGSWQFTVKVYSQGMTDNYFERSFYIDIIEQGQPIISINPESFLLQLLENETSSQVLSITNNGDSNLDVEIFAYSNDYYPFITQPVPNSINLPPNQSTDIIFDVFTTNINQGTYYGNLVLNSNDPDDPSVEIDVLIEVDTYFPDLKLPWSEGEEWLLTCSYGCNQHTDENNAYYSLDFDKPGLPEEARAPILSVANGVVVFANWNTHGYGNTVDIDLGFGYLARYAHLSEINVLPEQEIIQGQLIGRMGSTGGNWNDHLHFSLYRNGINQQYETRAKPEPMSDFNNFSINEGELYLSDNVPSGGELQPCIYTNINEWSGELILGEESIISLTIGNNGFADLSIYDILIIDESNQLNLITENTNYLLSYEEDINIDFLLSANTIGEYSTNIIILNGDDSNNPFEINIDFLVESVNNLTEENKIDEFILFKCYPNPFNPITIINYKIPKACHVVLAIYDINGNLIDEIENDYKNSGHYSISWEAKEEISSGIYFYSLTTPYYSKSKKMLLIK